jgi:hypothetical protein
MNIFMILCAMLGLLSCIYVHAQMVISDYMPSRLFFKIVNIGMVLLFICWFGIAYKLRKQLSMNEKQFRKYLSDQLPNWLAVLFAISVFYGIAAFCFFFGIAFYIAKSDQGSVQLVDYKFFESLSALLIPFYSFILIRFLISQFFLVKSNNITRCECCGRTDIPADYLFKNSSGQRLCSTCLKQDANW